MRTRALIRLAVILSVAGLTTAALAASADDFKAALAKAEAANKQAGALKNQWTTTADALKAAQKAAASARPTSPSTAPCRWRSSARLPWRETR